MGKRALLVAVARVLSILLLVAIAGDPSAAVAENGAVQKGITFFLSRSPAAAPPADKCCIGLNPKLKVPVGENAVGAVLFWCRLVSTGEYLKDEVDVAMTGQPSGHKEKKPLFVPNPVPSDDGSDTSQTDITVFTTTDSKPGFYTLVIHGRSTGGKGTDPRCRSKAEYPDISAPLAVAPTIKGKNLVWWFNGAVPKNYDTSIKLDALPAKQGPYKWKIMTGDDVAQFVNSKSMISTNVAEAWVYSKAAPPKNSGKAEVRVTVNNVQSGPFTITVKTPYRNQSLFTADKRGTGDFAGGYESFVHYKTLDQFGKVLPADVQLNEHFPAAHISDRANNWPLPQECGDAPHVCDGDFDPNDWQDHIALAAGAATLHPTAQPPQHPTLGNVRVDHFCGTWSIGDSHPGQGVKVQWNAWQRFRDHGRHCNIVSPPPDSNPACPATTSDCTGP